MAESKPVGRMVSAMPKPAETAGFRPPAQRTLGRERRSVALAELVATAGLALSTIVVVTVVSVGIARASVIDGVIDNEGGLFGVAMLLGLAFFGIGALSILQGGKSGYR